MNEERICKGCGKPIHFSIYKEGNGRCPQCQPGYRGVNFILENERPRIIKDAEKYVDQFNNVASKSDCYIAGASAEHELLKPQLEYADSVIKKLSESLVTRDGNLTSKLIKEKLIDERNRAIDECIQKIWEYKHIIFMAKVFADELRSLKK